MSKIKIGSIGVDAGMCFIGDPCYTLPHDASQRTILDTNGNDLWNRIVKDMAGKDYCSLNYQPKNHEGLGVPVYGGEGLGVCVTTGYGDGEYPVYAEIENGVVKSVTIKFV